MITSKLGNVTVVHSSEGMPIQCRYLDSPHFNKASNLFICLHWLFILYAPSKSHSNAYLLRLGIEHFTDFISLYNKGQPASLQATRYTDINSELFNRFINHIRDKGLSLHIPEKLKTAITVVARETGKLPDIALPAVPVKKSSGQLPLNPDGFDSLQIALITHIETLWQKLQFRLIVDEAKAYTGEEIQKILNPDASKEYIFSWMRSKEVSSLKLHVFTVKRLLARCPDIEIQKIADLADPIPELRELYKRTCGRKRRERDKYFETPHPDGYKSTTPLLGRKLFASWEVDPARAIKTFLEDGYPFNYDLELIEERYCRTKLTSPDQNCCDAMFLLIYRLTRFKGENNKNPGRVDDLLSLYYPTPSDMAGIVLFLMLQSGWNKETVLALDKDNFEHPLTGSVEESIKVIFSEKERSQGIGKSHHDAIRVNLPTREDDPVSAYTLIRLAAKLSEPLNDLSFDVIPAMRNRTKLNNLFLCMRQRSDWKSKGRHSSIAHPKTFATAVKQFLSLYVVVDNGKRLLSAKDLTGRLRPTWLLYKKKHNPIALLSMSLAHKDRDTTDIYYDSSPLAKKERLQRLRSEIEEVLKLLRTRQFKGMIGAQAQADASANLKVFYIPGQSRSLWACANQKKPDWIGSEIVAQKGGTCWELQECIFCSQIRIFEDSLPYLMERAMHLEEITEHGIEGSFASRVEKEIEAIRFILDTWGDESEINDAARYRRRNSPLLPRDISVLKIILGAEIANV